MEQRELELHIAAEDILKIQDLMAQGGTEKPARRPIRVDGIVQEDGSVQIAEFWAVRQEDLSVKEIALLGVRKMKEGYNAEKAVAWLRENGYTVREYPLTPDARSNRKGFRAFKGPRAWAIRGRSSILYKREQARKAMAAFIESNPGAPTNNFSNLNFAYDG